MMQLILSPLPPWVAAKRFAFRRLRVPEGQERAEVRSTRSLRQHAQPSKTSLRSALIRPSATFSQREKGEK